MIIRPVTTMISYQQKVSDEMYQDAIESNFSHEYMTPLNSIINNSKTVKDTIHAVFDKFSKNEPTQR